MDEHFKLGNAVIDDQHMELYRVLRRLAAVPDTAENASLISDYFDCLSRLIRAHFADEEALMEQIGLPDMLLQNHIAAHYEIVNEVTNIHLLAMLGERPSLWELCSRVSRWIIDHISDFDLLLKPYIQSAKQ